MARKTTFSPCRTDTDAGWRALIQEYEDQLAACGLVRTSDTGQIDPATAIRTANSIAGYSMWRFSDALQGTAPVFIKVEYGTTTSVGYPRAIYSVGTGTNGSGALVGLSITTGSVGGNYLANVAGNFDSYWTHSSGFFGCIHKVLSAQSASTVSPFSVVVQRTVDNSGLPTAEGVILIAGPSGSNRTAQCSVYRLTFTSPVNAISYAGNLLSQIVGGISDSRVGLDPQVFLQWTALPKVRPLVGSATYINSEISQKTVFTTTLVGTAPRSYLAAGSEFGQVAVSAANSSAMAILWEE